MVNAINLAKIVKFNNPFTTIVTKNKVKHSISIDDIFFQKSNGGGYSVIRYSFCFAPFKVMVNGKKIILVSFVGLS